MTSKANFNFSFEIFEVFSFSSEEREMGWAFKGSDEESVEESDEESRE